MGSYLGLLTADEIRRLIRKEDLVSGYVSIDMQLQPVGFDVTVAKVLTIDNMQPYSLAEAKEVFTRHMQQVLDLSMPLQTLRPYCLVTNEMFRLPDNITGECTTRSSLTRLGGVLGSGVIDPGYVGHLSFSLISTLPIIIHPNVRIAQVRFTRHRRTFKYRGQYSEKK
jgi:deoxycytidine triphosphate deaminase